MKEIISTTKAPGAIGPYSQGIKNGNMVFTSGQLPINSESGEMLTEIKAATRQSLENVKAIVEAAGATMNDVVKVVIFLADMKDFAAMNEVYAEFFVENCPSRSCFAVKELPKSAIVEIEAIAIIG